MKKITSTMQGRDDLLGKNEYRQNKRKDGTKELYQSETRRKRTEDLDDW